MNMLFVVSKCAVLSDMDPLGNDGLLLLPGPIAKKAPVVQQDRTLDSGSKG